MVVKNVENQKANSIISLIGGKTKEELLKRYLFSNFLHFIVSNKN